MYFIIYGDYVFTKHKGYFGEPEECPNCHKVYSPAFVKNSTWVHVGYIPIFRTKVRFYKMCPFCGADHELKKKEVKTLMVHENKEQSVVPYIKHVLANRPNNKWFNTDKSYELWVKDNLTNENLCLSSGLTKEQVKNIRKHRGLKRLEIITVQ